MGKGGVIVTVSGLLTLVAGGIFVLVRGQELRRARAEADTAELRHQAEKDELARRQKGAAVAPRPPAGAPPEKAVSPKTPPPAPAEREPARPADAASLVRAGTVWEGNADTAALRMEVTEAADGRFAGRLHWTVGGRLKMTARMTGRVTGSDQVRFEWERDGIEFGSGFIPAVHTGTLYPDPVPELRGRWALKSGSGSGSFRLRLQP